MSWTSPKGQADPSLSLPSLSTQNTKVAASSLGHSGHCHCHSVQSSPRWWSRAPLPRFALWSREKPHAIPKDVFDFWATFCCSNSCYLQNKLFLLWVFSLVGKLIVEAHFCIRKEHIGSAASRRLLCQCCCPMQPGLDPGAWHTPTLSLTAVELSGCSVSTPAPFSHCQIPCRASVLLVSHQEPLGRWSCSSQQAPLRGQAPPGHCPWLLGHSWQGWLRGKEPWHKPVPNHCLHSCLCPAHPSCRLSPRVLTPSFVAL